MFGWYFGVSLSIYFTYQCSILLSIYPLLPLLDLSHVGVDKAMSQPTKPPEIIALPRSSSVGQKHGGPEQKGLSESKSDLPFRINNMVYLFRSWETSPLEVPVWPPFFIGYRDGFHQFFRVKVYHHPKGSTMFQMVATTSRKTFIVLRCTRRKHMILSWICLRSLDTFQKNYSPLNGGEFHGDFHPMGSNP